MNKIYTFSCLIIALLASQQAYSQALTKIWDKTFGGNFLDYGTSVVATSDGGFVIAGTSASGISVDKTQASRGTYDYWIVKVNSTGQKVWDKTLGGSLEERCESIVTTSDGGFVVAGYSYSGTSVDKTEASKGNSDYWIVKLNSLGQKVWDKTIGGSDADDAQTIAATNDGGFVICGTSISDISGDKTEARRGFADYWVVKLNSLGQKVWDKTIGSSDDDSANSITASSDGSFTIVGSTQAGISGDKTEASRGSYDYWIVNLNSLGQKVWDKTIGGSSFDIPESILATNDGGFVIVGDSQSGISGDKTEISRGFKDYWVVKLNSTGHKVWDKTIGGSSGDIGTSITENYNGDLTVTGTSASDISGDKTEVLIGRSDFWVVNLSSLGQKIWEKTTGGTGVDESASIIKSSDGGFVIAGKSSSGISGDKTEAHRGNGDYWIVKLQESTVPATTFDSATSGNWNATATWTCNCIPNGTLPVRIMSTHNITVPTAYTGQAKGLRFISTGKVTLQGTGKVNVVN